MAIEAGQTGLASDVLNIFCASKVAAENISANDAVCFGDGNDSVLSAVMINTTRNTSEQTSSSNANWFAQSFTTTATTTKIQSITIASEAPGAIADVTVSIRSSLTGSDLASGSYSENTSGGSGGQDRTITITGGLTVTPNTTYYIVFRTTNGQNCKFWGATTSTYSGGTGHKSTNSGGSWVATATALDFRFEIYEATMEVNKFYKANATNSGSKPSNFAINFIGFARSTVTAGQTLSVQTQNIVSGFSGLSTGSTYYLSNTGGAISTSSGGYNKKIGVAISTTEILIKNANV